MCDSVKKFRCLQFELELLWEIYLRSWLVDYCWSAVSLKIVSNVGTFLWMFQHINWIMITTYSWLSNDLKTANWTSHLIISKQHYLFPSIKSNLAHKSLSQELPCLTLTFHFAARSLARPGYCIVWGVLIFSIHHVSCLDHVPVLPTTDINIIILNPSQPSPGSNPWHHSWD